MIVDLAGPFKTTGRDGSRYIQTAVCDATSYVSVKRMKVKTDYYVACQKLVRLWNAMTPVYEVKEVWTNNTGEYIGSKATDMYEKPDGSKFRINQK